jgi:glycine cleavage system protein P-like pyridoxal-binding family
MKPSTTLFILLLSAAVADCGKVLVWLPVVSKSMKITYTPLVEELARRGHQVTVAHPFKSKEKMEGLTEIQSIENLEEHLSNVSRCENLSYMSVSCTAANVLLHL